LLEEPTLSRIRLAALILGAQIELTEKTLPQIFEFDKPNMIESQFVERLRTKANITMEVRDIKFLIESLEGTGIEFNQASFSTKMSKPILLQKIKNTSVSIVVLMWCLLSSILEYEVEMLNGIEKAYTAQMMDNKEEIEEVSAVLKEFFGSEVDSVLVSRIYTDYMVKKEKDVDPLLFAQTCLEILNEDAYCLNE